MDGQVEQSPGGPSSEQFAFRRVVPADKDEVLQFTAKTWEGGDYIDEVFDGWVEDRTGLFLAAEDKQSGQIAGIDKLSLHSPSEAWFEGLRVNPVYRGRGLATLFQHYMINEARLRGASTIRFITGASNTPIHRGAYRDGFGLLFTVAYRTWSGGSSTSEPVPSSTPAVPELRAASADECPALFSWWQRSASHTMTAGLIHRGWAFSETSREEWARRAGKQEVLVRDETRAPSAALPPAFAIVSLEDGSGGPTGRIDLLSAGREEWPQLAVAVVAWAKRLRLSRLTGMFPEYSPVLEALEAQGFTDGNGTEPFALFELRLQKHTA